MEWRAHIARYGQRGWPGEPWVRWTFLALFILAAVLRFWDLVNIPYTHDELSALVRIYPTLGETIQRGVIELDTHPPGVQVFEWFWTKLFGMSEAAVKLPFLIMSMVALFLLYRFALAWTSAPTALVTTALLASLQFTVMYAQIARPYAVGLFTTALLADQLTRYLAFGKRTSLIMVGVAAVLSAYTHHFALLLAAIMVVTGFSLIRKDQRKVYLLMCACAALAYLPNLPIFFKQLSLGGLSEWLSPPDRYWLSDLAQWLLHYSPLFGFVIGSLLVVALRGRVLGTSSAGPARWFLLLWGLLPVVIGLAYSVWRAPVIQYSMVLFSFPYFVIAVFAGLGKLGRLQTLGVSALIALLGTATLVRDRRHYELFYASKYDVAVDRAVELVFAEYGPNRTLVLMDMPDPQVQFALGQHHLLSEPLVYINIRGMKAASVDSVLRASNADVVLLGSSNGGRMENVAHLQSVFPFVLERQDLVEGQVFVLGRKEGERTVSDRKLLAQAFPGQRSGGAWDIHEDLPINGEGEMRTWDLSGRDFGVAFDLLADTCMVENGDLFEVVVEMTSTSGTTDAAVTLELHVGDSLMLYRTAEFMGYSSDRMIPVVLTVSREDVRRMAGPVRIKAYVYNRSKADLQVRSMKIFRREADPVRYGHFTRIGLPTRMR